MKKTIILVDGGFIKVETLHTGEGGIYSEGIHQPGAEFDEYNAAVNGLESLILGLACASVDVSTPQFQDGVRAALEAINNQY